MTGSKPARKLIPFVSNPSCDKALRLVPPTGHCLTAAGRDAHTRAFSVAGQISGPIHQHMS